MFFEFDSCLSLAKVRIWANKAVSATEWNEFGTDHEIGFCLFQNRPDFNYRRQINRKYRLRADFIKTIPVMGRLPCAFEMMDDESITEIVEKPLDKSSTRVRPAKVSFSPCLSADLLVVM